MIFIALGEAKLKIIYYPFTCTIMRNGREGRLSHFIVIKKGDAITKIDNGTAESRVDDKSDRQRKYYYRSLYNKNNVISSNKSNSRDGSEL